MNHAILAAQVRDLMAETFAVDVNELPEHVSQATYAAWTSLLHMVLLVALEERFAVTFSMDEMTAMTSLDQVVNVLLDKQRAGSPV